MILKVAGKQFDFFSRFRVSLKYDAIASGFSFAFFFDRELHKPLHDFRNYSPVKVEHNGETLITGRIVKHGLSSEPAKSLNSVAGYSITGVLENSTIPHSLYPVQVDGMTLRQLTEKFIKPFGLSYVVDTIVEGEMDKTYEDTKFQETSTIKAFLATLAAQRGIVLSHTPGGLLRFTRAAQTAPVLNFADGGIPGLTMSLDINGQGLHNEIIVMKDADPEIGAGTEDTLINPFCSIVKSTTKSVTSTDGTDTSKALKSALSADLRNIKLTVNFDRWDVNNKIIRPGDIITVKDGNLMMKNKVRWFVESVTLQGDKDKMTSSLSCVLPEVYTGETPNYVFA